MPSFLSWSTVIRCGANCPNYVSVREYAFFLAFSGIFCVSDGFKQVQRVSVSSPNRGGEVQIVEALSLPEGDPVYEVSIRGWGWQKERQQIRAGAAPASNETEVQVSDHL